jgi:hypothetical protein
VDDDSSDSCYVTKNKDDIKNIFSSEDSILVLDDDNSDFYTSGVMWLKTTTTLKRIFPSEYSDLVVDDDSSVF